MDLSFLLAAFGLLLQVKYLGIILIMFLDNTVLPFPGEVVLLLAGYLIYLGQMSFWLVVVSCAIGALAGAATGYEIGRRWGEPFIESYGRYVLLNKGHMHRAYGFFRTHGPLTVFYARFIPGVGHLISIPAGAAKMNRAKFLAFSFTASFVWYLMVTYLGYLFSRQWERFFTYSKQIQIAGLILIVILLAIYIGKRIQQKRAHRSGRASARAAAGKRGGAKAKRGGKGTTTKSS